MATERRIVLVIVVNLILQCFSAEALRCTTVVFICGDNPPPGMGIKDWAQEDPALREFLERCGNRCYVVDNNQVQDLLQTVEVTASANGGLCFTSDVLESRSLWQRFKDAPLGVQILVVSAVAVSGYLIYMYVPWAKATEWVILSAKNGVPWIWQNLPTTDQIKKLIEYLSELDKLVDKGQKLYKVAKTVSSVACSVM